MNLRSLEYFAAVAKELHFNRAANKCGGSQPALSIQLKKLEDDLGVKLFERNNKRIIITPAGEEILSRTQRVLQEVNEIKAIAHNLNDPYSGELKLGAFPTLSPFIFPRIIPDLRVNYPQMKFFLYEEKTADLLTMLDEGSIDAAFIALPHKDNLLESDFVFKEDFLLAAPVSHSICERTKASIATVQQESLLLLAEGHCLRDQALDFCSQNSISEHFDFKASSLETLRQMVAAGVGMTLIPECAIQESKDIKYLPFSGKTPSRQIALFWRKTSIRADVLREIADDVRRMWMS
ncbi:MAG: LysR substrate-binding domain-containing protein [Lentisphaerales bacterium]|nr:LysR substrate-binding domain-containing protein [Lentisphaerales bacterium]